MCHFNDEFEGDISFFRLVNIFRTSKVLGCLPIYLALPSDDLGPEPYIMGCHIDPEMTWQRTDCQLDHPI
jgi:hypothetical protein